MSYKIKLHLMFYITNKKGNNIREENHFKWEWGPDYQEQDGTGLFF